MSERIITIHNQTFTVEIQGHRGEEEARDNGVAAIEDALRAMTPAEVADIAAECRAWIKDDCQAVTPARIEALCRVGHAAVTEGWYRADDVMVSIGA